MSETIQAQLNRVFIEDDKLSGIKPGSTLNERALALLKQQEETWPLFQGNKKGLTEVEVKTFDYGHHHLVVQFNPARIRSSAAKVDSKSIKERKCFLCPGSLSSEQKGLPFGKDYLILVNPFPIFPQHLTIPHVTHQDQRIEGKFGDMLLLGRELKDFTLFYNGPKCGASAPDHFHFQAGNQHFLPIEGELESLILNHSECLFSDRKLKVHAVSNYLRKFIAFQSEDSKVLTEAFDKLLYLLKQRGQEPEPMLNILVWYREERWHVIVFPRDRHRPEQYFAEGEKNILLSPASVDFGGVCITPQEHDFNKITANDLADIFHQVSINDGSFKGLTEEFANQLKQ